MYLREDDQYVLLLHQKSFLPRIHLSILEFLHLREAMFLCTS